MKNVRRATAADAEALAVLRFEFRSSLETATEARREFVVRCAAWMKSRLAADGPWRCWVAEDGEGLLGHAWLEAIEKVPNPITERETHAYLTNVYVRPAHRGQGWGDALVEAALQWCRDREVDSVILWPTERSRTLYGRHGFAPSSEIMEARPNPAPPRGGS
jgi:GNAT superfamily N-acetyltransferase